MRAMEVKKIEKVGTEIAKIAEIRSGACDRWAPPPATLDPSLVTGYGAPPLSFHTLAIQTIFKAPPI